MKERQGREDYSGYSTAFFQLWPDVQSLDQEKIIRFTDHAFEAFSNSETIEQWPKKINEFTLITNDIFPSQAEEPRRSAFAAGMLAGLAIVSYNPKPVDKNVYTTLRLLHNHLTQKVFWRDSNPTVSTIARMAFNHGMNGLDILTDQITKDAVDTFVGRFSDEPQIARSFCLGLGLIIDADTACKIEQVAVLTDHRNQQGRS